MTYWQQKASPIVSGTVLVGGVLIAVLLFFLVKVEQSAQEVFGGSNFYTDNYEIKDL